MHHSFNRRLGLIEEKASDVQREIELRTAARSVEHEIQSAMEEGSVPSRTERAIRTATDYLARDPRSRWVNMNLAKLLFERKKDKLAAISALSAYIEFLDDIPSNRKSLEDTTDLADALYDRACYYLNPPGPVNKDGYNYEPTHDEQMSAMQDLRKALQLTPEPVRVDAQDDPDFKWLREHNSEFQALLGIKP